MKNSAIAIIIVVILVIGWVYLFVNKDKYFAPKEDNINQTTGPQTYNIEISNLAFNPSELNIKVGDTVIWTNKEDARHVLFSLKSGEISSKTLSKGDTYSHTFNKVGEFNYSCAVYYNKLNGKIIVS